MTNSLDLDETAHYEPSHMDIHFLQKYLFYSPELKGLKFIQCVGQFAQYYLYPVRFL